MIDGLTNSDGIPALERMVQFTSQRHRMILNNIANLSTPGFRPVDVSPEKFQKQLRAAIEQSHSGVGGGGGGEDGGIGGDGALGALGIDGLSVERPRADSALAMESSDEIEIDGGRMILHPEPTGDNLLFHDGNDRNVERVMQSLVENFMAYRAAAQLMRNRFEAINTAIRERV